MEFTNELYSVCYALVYWFAPIVALGGLYLLFTANRALNKAYWLTVAIGLIVLGVGVRVFCAPLMVKWSEALTSDTINHCVKCGTELAGEFCHKCGAAVDTVVKCTKCGLEAIGEFCHGCGAAIK